MLETLRNAFKVKDIRTRIFFTFLMLVVIRIGSEIPVPGVDSSVFKAWFESTAGGLSFFDAVTGGSFLNMSVLDIIICPNTRNGVAVSDESRKKGISIPILLHLMPQNPANNDKTIFDVIWYLQKQVVIFSISMNMR